MDKGRMEAFSDGVIAIIITIMVLGITAPDGDELADLLGLLPAIAAYAVSFVGVGTYWNNHHHLLKLVNRVTGRMLWSNLAFLFVLSFFPLATDWMQKTEFAARWSRSVPSSRSDLPLGLRQLRWYSPLSSQSPTSL